MAITIITTAMEEFRGYSTDRLVGTGRLHYVTQVPKVSSDYLHIKLGSDYWYCDNMVRVTTGTTYQHNLILINNDQ